jgi:hypothetical protein
MGTETELLVKEKLELIPEAWTGEVNLKLITGVALVLV